MNYIPNGKQAITQWSYSRFSNWEACPRSAFYASVLKMKTPSSPAMERGSRVHKDIEDYLKGTKKKLPIEVCKEMVPQYKQMLKEKYVAEGELAFTRKWEQTTWFAPDVFVRIKIDAMSVDYSDIVDHKTGRQRGTYGAQMELYGLAGHLLNPALKEVKTRLMFLENNIVVEEKFKVSTLRKFTKMWDAKVKPMLDDRDFPATPSQEACHWCPHKKSLGGPCPENT